MKYILGLDMGTTSLGWAIVKADANGAPVGLENMGVRIFPDGRDDKSKEPLSVARRDARGMRRNHDRRLSRRERLMEKLVEYGFMPSDKTECKALEKLDPYELRVRALDEKLPSFELGRALFHINQRRGFQSNAKTDRASDEKELSGMKLAIDETKKKIMATGARTYGEYLYKLNAPDLSTQRRVPIRIRKSDNAKKGENPFNVYPDRELYLDEVKKILSAQNISFEITNDLINTIFYQRDLLPQERGKCQFEKDQPRAFIAMPTYQRFRTLQQINQLRIMDDKESRDLDDKQRALLILNTLLDYSNLDKKHILTWAKIKKILDLRRGITFNLESEKRTGIHGDRTGALMSDESRFGAAWNTFDRSKQNEIVSVIMESRKDADAIEKLKSYGLDEVHANSVYNAKLEDSVGSVSVMAADKINPFLETGMLYNEAVDGAGYKFARSLENIPEHYDFFMNPETGEVFDTLPKYFDIMPEKCVGGKINNPTVHIALNQLCRVVNDIVKKYGFPERISIELARDLNMGLEKRREVEKEQAKNQKDNERIDKELERLGIKANYDNRIKYKLWEDLSSDPNRRMCPFCGKQISEPTLFSREFEIEHLLPFSRTYLDKRSNKVISCAGCNRIKDNRTPFEAFGHTNEWRNILARMDNFPESAESKKWKFRPDAMEKFADTEKVLSRALTDTQYMTKVAREYMTFVANPKNVLAVKGGVTAQLRHHWGLEFFVGDETAKDRKDHRHHAIDAFVVACTDNKTLQRFSAEKYSAQKTSNAPYSDFQRKDVQDLFDEIVISYKPDVGDAIKAIKQPDRAKNKTVGKLHEDTFYGPAKPHNIASLQLKIGKGKTAVAIRNSVHDILYDSKNKLLTDKNKILKNIAEIADVAGTAIPLKKLLEGQPVEKYQEIIEDYFSRRNTKKFRTVSIKDKVIKLNNGKRFALGGGNAYAEIYVSDRGKEAGKWQIEIVSNFDAHQKMFVPNWRNSKNKEKFAGGHAKLIMRLHIDDMVAYNDEKGQRQICQVKKLNSVGSVDVNSHLFVGAVGYVNFGSSKMQSSNFRKIHVDNLGRVFDNGMKKNETNN